MAQLLVLLAFFLSVPACAEVSIQEYPIPDGLYAHDVWADPAPGGPVYFSAQRSGDLGILDPKSGKVETVNLGRGAAPHGVIQGADGAVWLTDGGRNAIVRVDPKTKELKRFALPEDGGHANLNTAAFDGQGALWFTGQAGVYGRLDPKSGAMKIFQAPRGPGPYGIQSTPGGTPYFASLAGSYVARIDVTSGAARLIGPPTPHQGARRVWADAGGRLWVSEWTSGNLSRYDPASGAWKSWKAPGRAPHLYAVYVDESGKVWASDWTTQTMLRFDPASERFETFKSSSEHANVRQIHGRRGEVWTPESAADKLVVYRYK